MPFLRFRRSHAGSLPVRSVVAARDAREGLRGRCDGRRAGDGLSGRLYDHDWAFGRPSDPRTTNPDASNANAMGVQLLKGRAGRADRPSVLSRRRISPATARRIRCIALRVEHGPKAAPSKSSDGQESWCASWPPSRAGRETAGPIAARYCPKAARTRWSKPGEQESRNIGPDRSAFGTVEQQPKPCLVWST